MITSLNSFGPYPKPQICPLEPEKGKNDHKIKSNSQVRIEGTIENKSV